MPTYKSSKPSYQHHSGGSNPPIGSTAVFEWNSLASKKHFWRLSAEQKHNALMNILQEISQSIIERPYHYDPHTVIFKNNPALRQDHTFQETLNHSAPKKNPDIAVYKLNHGTGHALRQMIHTEKLLEWFTVNGNERGKKTASFITTHPEIKEALKLAAYCMRLGRTLDGESDSARPPNTPAIYTKRSSDMFKMIAEELGFNSAVISILEQSMQEPPSQRSGFLGVEGFSGDELFRMSFAILKAAHKADLTRMFVVNQKYVSNDLKNFVDEIHLKKLVKSVVELGCKTNELTGSGVVKQDSPVKNQEVNADAKKLVAVVKDIPGTYAKLSASLTLLSQGQSTPAPEVAAIGFTPSRVNQIPAQPKTHAHQAPKQPANPKPAHYNILAPKPPVPTVKPPLAQTLPNQAEPHSVKKCPPAPTHSARFFPPQQPKHSCLSMEQLNHIQQLIKTLQAEKRSFWALNVDRKKVKIAALEHLKDHSYQHKNVQELAQDILKKYPDANKGILSNRTGEFLMALKHEDTAPVYTR